MSTRMRQHGQALVMVVLFTAVAGLAVLLMFNNAMLANTKSQLQNAADAAAYSSGLLQARDHNFSAYTNRAMIANQVAVAQFVSLDSYSKDAAATHDRLDSIANTVWRWFPDSAPAWDAGEQVPVDTMRSGVASIASAAVTGIDLLIQALETAQQSYHLGTMAEVFLVANEVVQENDPKATVTQGAFMAGEGALRLTRWDGLTKRHHANDASAAADRFADAVVDDKSTDSFIRNRTSVPLPMWVSSVKFCFGADISITDYQFLHFGGTLLSSDKKRWLGLDASQAFGGWFCHWTCPLFDACAIGGTFQDVSLGIPPLGGSGGSQAGNGGGYGASNFMRGYKSNPALSWFFGGALVSPSIVPAELRFWLQGPGTTLDSKGGLQDHYRDIKDFSTTPGDQTPEKNGGEFPLVVEVEHRAADVRTSSKVLPDSQRLRLDDAMQGQTMRTIATAHAFFYRPKSDDASQFTRNGWRRDGGGTEMQNLFSPYWQARLAPNGVADEAASLAVQ